MSNSLGRRVFVCHTPNTACTRPPHERRGRDGGSLLVFRHFAWLEVGSAKIALSHPAHQRVTPTVGRLRQNRNIGMEGLFTC